MGRHRWHTGGAVGSGANGGGTAIGPEFGAPDRFTAPVAPHSADGGGYEDAAVDVPAGAGMDAAAEGLDPPDPAERASGPPGSGRPAGKRRWAIPFGAACVLGGLLTAWLLVGLIRHDWAAPAVRPVAEIALSPEPSEGEREAPAKEAESPAGATPTGAPPRPEPGSGSAAVLVVHVAGAVQRPGVVHPASGTRVYEAIELAGGATADADLDNLNLAAPLLDGQQIFVPAAGSTSGSGAGGAGGGAPDGAAGGNPQAPAAESGGREAAVRAETGAALQPGARVNINRAGLSELDTLPRVGPVLAQRIIDFRTEHGPFQSPEELDGVPGIGSAMLAALVPLVSV